MGMFGFKSIKNGCGEIVDMYCEFCRVTHGFKCAHIVEKNGKKYKVYYGYRCYEVKEVPIN